MYDLLIQNGDLVLPEGVVTGSILVKDGVIAAITKSGNPAHAAKVVDARGCYVLPGAIDTHSHLNDPGYTESEDFLTGTCSAAAGGFTTVLEMPISNPVPATSRILEEKKAILEKKAVVDFGLWGSLIAGNEEELVGLAESGAVGVKGFLTEDPLYPAISWGLIAEYMPKLAESGMLFALHCETPEINDVCLARLKERGLKDPSVYPQSRPAVSELLAVSSFAFFARQYPQCRFYLVHSSLAGSVELALEAREHGGNIFIETCPHYLAMEESALKQYGAFAVCNPPLRTDGEREALWRCMLDGKIDTVGSDHAPFLFTEKAAGNEAVWDAPPGFTSIQTCYPLFFDEAVNKRGMPVTRFAEVTSTNAAKLFGLYPRKGSLMIGTDADMTILDPRAPWTVRKEQLYYKQPWSPFIGWEITGKIVSTVVRGTVVYNGADVSVQPGFGRFIRPKQI